MACSSSIVSEVLGDPHAAGTGKIYFTWRAWQGLGLTPSSSVQ